MSANLARTAGGWWVVTPAGLMPLAVPTATTTGGLLADRAALDEAVRAAQAAPPRHRAMRSRPNPPSCSAR